MGKWWQDWRWIAATGFLVFAMSFTGFVTSNILNEGEIDKNAADIEDLEQVVTDTKEVADFIRAIKPVFCRNNEAIAELEFCQEVEQ